MNDIERIIGKLEAHHEHSETRFDQLETKVDALWVFRWKVAGMSMAASAIIAAIFELIHH